VIVLSMDWEAADIAKADTEGRVGFW